MHELSVAESIIDLIFSSVDSKYLNRVTKVNLKFGELNNINRDSLEFGYSCLIENSDLKSLVDNLLTIDADIRQYLEEQKLDVETQLTRLNCANKAVKKYINVSEE